MKGEEVTGKEVRVEKRRVTETKEAPVRASGGRQLRQRPPQTVTRTVDVPVVWYELKWTGWDERTWQRASDCHCQQLIDEYELRQQQRAGRVEELAVATVVEWRPTDKHTSSRRGQPTVRCSYACVQPLDRVSMCADVVRSCVRQCSTSVVVA